MKQYTDLKQSKKLAEILPVDGADMFFLYAGNREIIRINDNIKDYNHWDTYPVWSLAALFDVIKDKCGYFEFVYLKRTSDGRANPLEDVYRLSTDVYDVYKTEPVDACYEMILILHEQKLL